MATEDRKKYGLVLMGALVRPEVRERLGRLARRADLSRAETLRRVIALGERHYTELTAQPTPPRSCWHR